MTDIRNLPPLPVGSTWRENLFGLPAAEANLILLRDGRVLDCTDVAACLNWNKTGTAEEIMHWTAVIEPQNHTRDIAA